MSKVLIAVLVYTVLFALVLPAVGAVTYTNYAAALLVGCALTGATLFIARLLAQHFINLDMLADLFASPSLIKIRSKIIALNLVAVLVPFVVTGLFLSFAITVVSWTGALALVALVAAVHGYFSVWRNF
jgi:hypothetical protein